MDIIKLVTSSIISPLKYMFNLSLKSGGFPDNMKIAKVVPIYMSGPMSEISNYIPTSLLPQFSE